MAIIPYINDYGKNVNELGQTASFVGVNENPSGGSISIPVIYGQRRVEGIRFWTQVSATNSSVMYCAYALSEGWCQGMTQLFVDDVLVALSPTDFQHRVPITVSSSTYAGILEIEFVDGRSQETYYGSVANVGPSTMLQRDLTKNFAWEKLCYIVCKFTYVVNGPYDAMPKITVDLAGRKIPNFTSTNAANYTVNPAYVIWDLMNNSVYGRGISKDLIDATSFTAAATACALNRPSLTITQPIYSVNWICETNNSLLNNIKLILETFQLNLSFIANKWYLTAEHSPNAAGASNYTFNENNIIGDVSVQYSNISERYNRVIVEYIEPVNNYQNRTEQFPPVGTTTYLDEDNGLILEKRIQTNMIANAIVANDLAQMTLKRSRNQLTYRFTTTKEAYQLQIGDYVFINTNIPNIVNQKCIVISMTMNPDSTIRMECVSYDPSWYPNSFTNSLTLPAGSGTVTPPVIVPTSTWTVTSTRDTNNFILVEGQSIVWTINTVNVANGTAFTYTIEGVSIGDLAGDVFSGSGTISSSTATILRTATSPNTRNGNRSLILKVRDSSGTLVAQWTGILTDATAPPPSTTFTYTFTGALTLDDNVNYYLGWVNNATAPAAFNATKTKAGVERGYNFTVTNNYATGALTSTGAVTFDLRLGLIDRASANQGLDKKIFAVWQEGTGVFGYRKQNGLAGTGQYGREVWRYDPESPPYITTNKFYSKLEIGSLLRASTVGVFENINGPQTNFDNGTVQLTRVAGTTGQYETILPIRFLYYGNYNGVSGSPWRSVDNNGGFFSLNDWDATLLNALSSTTFTVKFFQCDATSSTITYIGKKAFTLNGTANCVTDESKPTSRTAWISKFGGTATPF